MSGLLGVSHFCAGRPGEAHEEHKEEENAGEENRSSRQQKIRPESLNQPGHQFQYQPHTQSVAEVVCFKLSMIRQLLPAQSVHQGVNLVLSRG
jgi:hypothetical protein